MSTYLGLQNTYVYGSLTTDAGCTLTVNGPSNISLNNKVTGNLTVTGPYSTTTTFTAITTGSVVTLVIAGFTGTTTSATSFTLTGLPSGLIPPTTTQYCSTIVYNGAIVNGVVEIITGTGNIQIGPANSLGASITPGGFSNAVTASVGSLTITYQLV